MDRSYLLKKQNHGMQNWCPCLQNTFALSVGTLIVLPFLFLPWEAIVGVLIFGIIWILNNRQ